MKENKVCECGTGYAAFKCYGVFRCQHCEGKITGERLEKLVEVESLGKEERDIDL